METLKNLAIVSIIVVVITTSICLIKKNDISRRADFNQWMDSYNLDYLTVIEYDEDMVFRYEDLVDWRFYPGGGDTKLYIYEIDGEYYGVPSDAGGIYLDNRYN